jgi:tetratricopeptide (TPR) repeat protein
MGMKSHVFYLRGQALRLSDRFDLAIINLKRSLEINSQNIHGLMALGWSYKRIGQLSLAIEALEAALEVNCENAVVHYNLACYWALANQPNLSVFHLSAALDLNPGLRNHISNEADFDLIRHRSEFMAAAKVIA